MAKAIFARTPGDEREQVEATRSTISFDTTWGVIALLSLIALGMLAPAGLWLLVFLGVIILVHEAGHFFVAKASGMQPTEFFWGFGPEIIAVQRGDLRVGLKAVFIGGYVKIPGMTPSEVVAPEFDEARTYRAASHTGRLLTILAGPATNLICAVGAFAVAAKMGGHSLVGSFGVAFEYIYIVVEGTAQALWTWVTGIGGYLGATVDGSQPPVRFLSPISQAEITSDAIDAGLSQALIWFGILSCAIGGINLLPLPPLDGSHAVMAIAEWFTQIVRRDRSIRFDLKRLEPLAYATLFALAILSVSALVMDIRGVPLS